MIRIVYRDVPTGALEDVTITASNKQPFINMNDLKNETIQVTKYASFEENFFLLDDTFPLMPNEISNMEYMSLAMSDENGIFTEPVIITREYTERYTATGITIKFDTLTGDYCTEFNVKWYRDNEQITEATFYPTSREYVAVHTAEAYNKVVFEFRKTSEPCRYLKIHYLIDGMTRIFDKEELINATVIEEISDTGETLPINTMNFSIISKQVLAYIFQTTQPMKLYRGDEFIGTFFIQEASQKSQREFEVMTNDYVGIIDNENYYGGMYSGITAGTLIVDILGSIPYEIDASLINKTISGYLPKSTKRVALQQVIFGIGGIIDTSRNDAIVIKPLSNEVTSEIGTDRVFRNITTEISSITTKIQLTIHDYVAITSETQTAFENVLNGQARIEFTEPLHDLEITGGTIIQSHCNYAIISGSGSNVILTGYPYNDRQQIIEAENPMTTASTIEKIKKYESATLVTSSNALEVLARLESMCFSNKKVKCKLILQNEKVGDVVSVTTDYGIKTARIISLGLELNGKNKYAEAELMEV